MRPVLPSPSLRRLAPLLTAVLIGGCGQRHAPYAAYGPGPSGTPTRGGHVVFAREEDPDYLDPALSYGNYSAPVTEALFHGLLDYTDGVGLAGAQLQPDLAETLPELREGRTLYAFKLRSDARFAEPLGRHITAADVKYAIERLFRVASPGVGFYRGILGADSALAGRGSDLPGLIARGDSLYVRLTRPDPTFLQVFAMTFTAPVPREVVEAHPTDFTFHSIATGPFRVAEYVPRQRVLLVRNTNYCGAPAPLDTFELQLGIHPVNAVALIRRGQLDGGFFAIPAAESARLRRDPAWRRQIDLADGLYTDYLWMNVRRRPFDDVRVRQAVSWALDRRALLKTQLGQGFAAGEFLPPSMPGAAALARYFGPGGGADTAKARALLRAAGFPNGFTTKLYGMTTQPIPRELAVVQQQLAEVGIRAELDLGEAVGFSAMAGDTSRGIGFGWYAWYADYLDPSNFFVTLLHGRSITANNNLNLGLFDDPGVNAMMDEAVATADDSLRARRWQAVDRRVMDLAPVAVMTHLLEGRVYSPRLGGWYRHVTRILKIEELYLKAPGGPDAGAFP